MHEQTCWTGRQRGLPAVTALSAADCRGVAGFVRDALGCSCPPAVFDDIRLETEPAPFAGESGARLLVIGRRLLVLLVDAAGREFTRERVEGLLERGRRLRDSGGFNRFRLVLVAAPGRRVPAAPVVDGALAGDGRLHVHVVTAGQLPARLHAPAVCA